MIYSVGSALREIAELNLMNSRWQYRTTAPESSSFRQTKHPNKNLTFHKFLDAVFKSSGASKKSAMLPGLVRIELPRASRPIMNPRLHRNGNRSLTNLCNITDFSNSPPMLPSELQIPSRSFHKRVENRLAGNQSSLQVEGIACKLPTSYWFYLWRRWIGRHDSRSSSVLYKFERERHLQQSYGPPWS